MTTCVWESHQAAPAVLAEQLVSPSRNTLMGQQGRARVRKEKLWKPVHHGISHVGSLELCPGPWGHRVLPCITVISQGDQLPARWVLYCHYDVLSEGRRWCPETPWLLKQEQILVLLKLSLSWKEQSPPSNLEQLSRELPICLCLKNKSPCVLSGARHRSREEGWITHWHRGGDTKMTVNKTWGGGSTRPSLWTEGHGWQIPRWTKHSLSWLCVFRHPVGLPAPGGWHLYNWVYNQVTMTLTPWAYSQ